MDWSDGSSKNFRCLFLRALHVKVIHSDLCTINCAGQISKHARNVLSRPSGRASIQVKYNIR